MNGPFDRPTGPSARRQSVPVKVGHVTIGGGSPIVVQSMTNTDTADIKGTAEQVAQLARAGSEIVRITVDRKEAAAAVPPPAASAASRARAYITTPFSSHSALVPDASHANATAVSSRASAASAASGTCAGAIRRSAAIAAGGAVSPRFAPRLFFCGVFAAMKKSILCGASTGFTGCLRKGERCESFCAGSRPPKTVREADAPASAIRY